MHIVQRKFLIVLCFCLISLGLVFSPLFFHYQNIQAHTMQSSVTVNITACGNGIVETGEECDGADLDGQTCVGLGYAGGALTCNSDCTFNTSSCTSGGGGGGSSSPPPSKATKVIIQGKSYPNALITILKDGKVFTAKKADSSANFQSEITNIVPGVWTFSVWAEDKQGRKSITFSFTMNVVKNVITTISGIFLPPTIELSKVKLQKGETLDIYGQTAPESEVSISVESVEIIKKVNATEEGEWNCPFDTNPLDKGSHTARAKTISPEGLLSSYSQVLSFYVGEGEETPEIICSNADLNSDGKINLIDFSILLYWWGKDNPCSDQNTDGIIDLIDFSIMLYYWTG